MKDHGIEQVIPCKVQTLSTKTCFITYFGVADTSTQLSTPDATSVPISQIVKETMRDLFHVASTPDQINERDLFYVRTGWFPEPEAVDEYDGVNFKELLKIPQKPDEELYQTRAVMKDVIENSIKMVNSHPYSLRCLVNGTAAAKKAQAICSLQTEAAVKGYWSYSLGSLVAWKTGLCGQRMTSLAYMRKADLSGEVVHLESI